MIMRWHSKTLALLCAMLIMCVFLYGVYWSAPQTKPAHPRASSLQDRLESGQWRDEAAPAGGEVATDPEQFGEIAWPEEGRPRLPNSSCLRRVDVGVIFTKARQHPKMGVHLTRLLQTMWEHTSSCVHVRFFNDVESEPVIARAFADSGVTDQISAELYPMADLTERMRDLTELLMPHFAPRNVSYYRDALFFVTTSLHRALPDVGRIIMLDIDMSIRGDIAALDDHFESFSPAQVMGMAEELSPVYRDVLKDYRSQHPETSAGGPPPRGFPGYNSGVVLLSLAAMRGSQRYNSLLTPEEVLPLIARYGHFKGHLGDQDLYTLLALDDPQLFYSLPCGWNRQLCEFWRKAYPGVFDQYFVCSGDHFILHGNCRSELPPEPPAGARAAVSA